MTIAHELRNKMDRANNLKTERALAGNATLTAPKDN